MFDDAPTTSDRIAERLRAEIAAGNYEDGEPLRQDELARRFGVSKIPVREALQQLKSEGLVAFHQNRGSLVLGASAEEVAEVYAMRAALEELALTGSIPRLTAADLRRAEAALEDLAEARDPSEWPQLNWEFHAALYRPAGMPTLLRTLQSLHHSVARYLLMYLADEDHGRTSQAQHRELLEACGERDLRRAKSVLKRHLAQASRESQAYLRQRNQTSDEPRAREGRP
ncbi:MAG: GntR family transcriptional regulator [Truepera sp.]|jgi:DNA-binding GntR family transcriptional regulator|nr:GntR family transcriptional regulator [Truepera sp.]